MYNFEAEPCTLCKSQGTTKFVRIEKGDEMRGLLICDPCREIVAKYLEWYQKATVYQKEKK